MKGGVQAHWIFRVVLLVLSVACCISLHVAEWWGEGDIFMYSQCALQLGTLIYFHNERLLRRSQRSNLVLNLL